MEGSGGHRNYGSNSFRWRAAGAIEIMGRILLGVILGIVLVPVAAMCWFHFGHPPVAVSDPPLPMERQITGIPLHARINSEMVKTPPIQADENTFVAGAPTY